MDNCECAGCNAGKRKFTLLREEIIDALEESGVEYDDDEVDENISNHIEGAGI